MRIKRNEVGLLIHKDTLEDTVNHLFQTRLMPKKIFDLWNRISKEKGVTRCSFLSVKLKNRLAYLITIFSPEDWKVVFKEVCENEFLQESHWFNLSWISEPENFTKVLDGAYKRTDRKKHLPSNAVGDQKSVKNMLDEWRKKRKKEIQDGK